MEMIPLNRENEIIATEEPEFSAINVGDGSSFFADRILSSIPPDHSTVFSIYRVPDNLRKGNENKYEPSIVSIGPYHCAMQNLKITEKHKLWYLGEFLSRSTQPQTSFEDMVKAVKNLEEKARSCYAEEIHLSSDDFVKMMVIDGCFVLELIYRNLDYSRKDDDFIYCSAWLIETLKQDLVLLENQLPFIILVCLYQLINKHPNNDLNDLDDMVFDFFYMELGVIEFSDLDTHTVESNHILDFLRNRIIPREFNPTPYPMSFINYDDFPCAKDLQEIGVKFKVKGTLAFLDVTFGEGCLSFNYFRKGIMYSLFPNWIALEQCHCHFKGYITSYTLLLGQLINSKDDVKFLRKTGIFDGNEYEDEKFVTEIKLLCQRAKPFVYHYLDLRIDVERYTRTGWNRQRANFHNWNVILKRDYFSSPWAVISFIAAIVLLVLTAIQTIYTIRSYSPNKV